MEYYYTLTVSLTFALRDRSGWYELAILKRPAPTEPWTSWRTLERRQWCEQPPGAHPGSWWWSRATVSGGPWSQDPVLRQWLRVVTGPPPPRPGPGAGSVSAGSLSSQWRCKDPLDGRAAWQQPSSACGDLVVVMVQKLHHGWLWRCEDPPLPVVWSAWSAMALEPRSSPSPGHQIQSNHALVHDAGKPERIVGRLASDLQWLIPSYLRPIPCDGGNAELGGCPALQSWFFSPVYCSRTD